MSSVVSCVVAAPKFLASYFITQKSLSTSTSELEGTAMYPVGHSMSGTKIGSSATGSSTTGSSATGSSTTGSEGSEGLELFTSPEFFLSSLPPLHPETIVKRSK